MHATALQDMATLLQCLPDGNRTVLDVGSYDENGTHRPLIESRGWQYIGLDVRPGPNVDVVATDPYRYPFPDNHFDVVVSGQTMEHIEDLRAWIDEMARVLKPGGRLCIVTVWKCPVHRFPIDTWRILPDGMKWLFERNGQLTDYDIRITTEEGNIVGAATKRGKES